MGRPAKTILIYALAGPPIGAIFSIILASAFWVPASEDAAGGMFANAATLAMALLIGIPFSYVFGGLQALFVGLASALWQKWQGKVTLAVPLGLSFLAWVGFALVSHFVHGVGVSLSAFMFSQNGMLWLANHLVGGAASWRLAQKWAA